MLGVAQRESGWHPGIVGMDPAALAASGCWQITTGFNDDVIARYGGETQMFNPWVNAQAAKTIFDRQPGATGPLPGGFAPRAGSSRSSPAVGSAGSPTHPRSPARSTHRAGRR